MSKFVQCYFTGMIVFNFSHSFTPEKILKDFKSVLDSDKNQYNWYLKRAEDSPDGRERQAHKNNAAFILSHTHLSFPKKWFGKDDVTDQELLEFFAQQCKQYAKNIVEKFTENKLPVLFIITDSQQEDFKDFLKLINAEDRVAYRSSLAHNRNYPDAKKPYMQVVILDYTQKETV